MGQARGATFMNTREPATRDLYPGQMREVQVIKPLQLDEHTPQTTGMRRLAAISNILVGSEALWAGVLLAEPNVASSVHHHGPLETAVYVRFARSDVAWGGRL